MLINLDFYTQKNLSENYTKLWQAFLRKFASPVLHRKILMKGRQIISLPGQSTCLEPTLAKRKKIKYSYKDYLELEVSLRNERSGIESQWWQVYPHPSRPVPGPIRPPVQWVTCYYRGVKLLGNGVGHPPPPHIAPRLNKEYGSTSTPYRLSRHVIA